MIKLAINVGMFRMAFDRDIDYHDAHPQSIYMDRRSGEIIWVYEDIERARLEMGSAVDDNQDLREEVDTSPEMYLEIPGLSHAQHHNILKAFLDSAWTEHKSAKDNARSAYFGSIGGWIKTVNDEDAVNAYRAFRERRTKVLAEEFLRKHEIEPQWR